MWCVVLTATNVIVEVAKVVQKYYEHICNNASKFEECCRFFKGTLLEEAIIAMFLNNVRKALRVHTITIKQAKPSWERFLEEVTCMENEEPREGVVVKAPFIKPVLALEVEDSGKLSRREEEMAQEIENLKKHLNELERPMGKPRQEFGKGCRNKSNIKCFRCGNQDTLLENAEGDVSRVMILRLSKMYKERGKLMKAREKLGGAKWGGF